MQRSRPPHRVRRNPVLGEALAACRAHLVHAALFSALLNLLYLAPSLYMLQVYDRVVPTRSVATAVRKISVSMPRVTTPRVGTTRS